MYTKIKRSLLFLLTGIMMFICVACGSRETLHETDSESETEIKIEIVDATDILTKVWDEYEEVDTDGNLNNDRFDIMGGHFETAVIGKPAKYDLTKTADLVQMYCVAENEVILLDDAATLVDLNNAGRFTAGVYHLSNVENKQSFIEGIESQVAVNQWHGEKPEKLLIMEIEEQYVVSVYGREPLVNEFKQVLIDIYTKMANVVVEKNLQYN